MKPILSLYARCLFAVLLGVVCGSPAPAHAADEHGHDHGDEAATSSGPARPRFSAQSAMFELVGVMDGRQVLLYLDRFGDNSPVSGAEIELEIDGHKLKAEVHDEDTYELTLPHAPDPGSLAFSATVAVGGDSDRLVGEIDIHEAEHADEDVHAHSWTEFIPWVAAGAAGAALLMLFIGRPGRTEAIASGTSSGRSPPRAVDTGEDKS